MSKILVGRKAQKEVEVGNSLKRTTVNTSTDAEAKEELVEAPVEDKQVESAEEGDDAPAETQETPAKRRGKKRSKA